MDRRRLAVLGGLVVAAALALRRRRRRDAVDVAIAESEAPGSTAADEEPTLDDEGPTVELESIEGIGSAYAERLREAGVADGTDLATADVDALAEETGIGERRIRGWIERVGERDAS